MCKVIEDVYHEGAKEKATTAALRMLADGVLPLDKIAQYVGLTLEEVQKLQAGQGV